MLNFDKNIFFVIIAISEYVDMNPSEKKLVKISVVVSNEVQLLHYCT